MTSNSTTFEGGCTCRQVRYRMTAKPLFVHCCHCRWCQRETGAAFALNAMIEADRVELVSGEPEPVMTPSASGRGQKIWRCPTCRIAVWSNYGGAGDAVRFVRVGSLDEPDRLPPDIHIFTSSKQPWVVLPEGAPAVAEYYDTKILRHQEDLAGREPGAPRGVARQAELGRDRFMWNRLGIHSVILRACDFFDRRSFAVDEFATANFSVVLSAAKDLIAAWYECTL